MLSNKIYAKKKTKMNYKHIFKLLFSRYLELALFFFCLAAVPLGITKAQEPLSLQFSGGIITPFSSSIGFSGNVQLNYYINSTFSLYASTGYSGWDRNKAVFWDWGKTNPTAWGVGYRNFNSYTEDGHMLIPVYIGSTLKIFQTHSNLAAFLNTEIGYSYLSYNSYKQSKVVNAETGLTETFYADESTKKVNRENLFGAGLGIGLSIPVSGTSGLLLLYKLNSFVNNHYNGLLKTQDTYTSFTAGFNYTL